MSNEISTFAPPAGALDTASYANSLQIAAHSNVGGARDPILRLGRDGVWVYGQSNVELEDDTKIVVNPFAIQHGFQVWASSVTALLEEAWVSVAAPRPEPQRDLSDSRGPQHGFKFQMQIATGEDKGVDIVYAPTSVGGKNAATKLIGEIAAKVASEGAEGKIVPLISVAADHYVHKQYGKTYVPEITIVDWLPAGASAVEDEEPEPKRRRRA